MAEAKKHIDPVVPQFLLVGCKGDLGNARQVSTEEGAACAKSLGIHFLETSARTGKNVEEAFQTVTQEIYNRISTGEYKVDDDCWEGIKSGFGQRNNQHNSIIPMAIEEKSKCC